ncbi:NAD(P)-dependent oxidoreductase [Compostimonas suwonensis]|uniref:3-hydroxyisobutyrate dehydrogenase n=1 Tax=Compostimonas suwonensis TaxID=1048394 RepID=A0A2M9BCG4_9MICO|nr:NAD(P)-dependent oxidoreductase [Compostimonas suwonensis]PJJ55612.1 3-hydroxyisobutyrate dehydrogenase [Compostimonas suwonensis]
MSTDNNTAAPTGTIIGVCGLGNMGSALADRLAVVGPVVGFDLSEARRQELADRPNITTVATVPELAPASVIVFSLPTPQISAAVAEQLLPSLSRGTLIIETSTVNPSDMQKLQEKLAPRGVRIIDAALLSGVAQMIAGEAVVLAGGDDDDLDDAEPYLRALGEVTRMGGIGSAMAAKVIHNAVIHAVMVVLVEGAALAASTGVSGADLVRILQDTERGLMRPLSHRYGERILDGDYEGGMPTEAARKDSTLALALAQEAKVPLFAISASHTVYEIATNEGYGRLDYAAIAKLWEGWLDRSLASEGETPDGA